MPDTTPGEGVSKLPPLDSPDANPVVAEMFNSLTRSGARILNVHRTLAHAPHVLKGWGGLSRSLRHDSKLDRALCELAIMRQSQLMKSDYEWYVHRAMCRTIGMPDEKIDEMANWEASEVYTDVERLVLRYTDAVVSGHDVDPALFAEVLAKFGTKEFVELTATICYFIGTSFLLNTLGVRVGEEESKLNPG